MRREAEEAQLVVVNHHLFFADLALRAGSRGDYASVLPAYDAVIFDEAHEVEDIATDFFGVRLSNARVEALARDAHKALVAVPAKGSPATPLAEQMTMAARAFFQLLGASRSGGGESRRILSQGDWSRDALAAAAKLDAALAALAAEAEARSKGGDAALQVGRRARDTRADLREVMKSAKPVDDDEAPAARVAWVHAGARSVALGVSLVELGGVLREALFGRVPSVVCTSATLATATSGHPSCHFARARLGAPAETRELVLASPFDFASRAALYLPRDVPDPGDPGFDAAVADRAAALVGITGGGAFVLCTSNRAMKRIHESLRARLRGPLLLQGEAPNHVLLDRFKRAGDAVLVATMSFWEGVDVPGHALRLVVIDKIPFAVPTDPVVMARCAVVERSGGNPFTQYSVPSAAITLKQGFGRLLRSEKDVGIVAILDRRMTMRGYGRSLVASLPPARRMGTLDEVTAFWRQITGASDADATPARGATP
jgi:ATP-dependent DNA helicase DinG